MGPGLPSPERPAEISLHGPQELRASRVPPGPFVAAVLVELLLGCAPGPKGLPGAHERVTAPRPGGRGTARRIVSRSCCEPGSNGILPDLAGSHHQILLRGRGVNRSCQRWPRHPSQEFTCRVCRRFPLWVILCGIPGATTRTIRSISTG